MTKKKNLTEEKIKRILDETLAEKNDNPRDSTYRFLKIFHGEAQHISLRLPGKYVKTLPTEVFTIDNRTYQMDGATLVLPDDTLPCKSIVNSEQQTTPVSPRKKERMYDYKLHMSIKYKLVAVNVIVTNIGSGDHEEIYETHGDAYKVYFRVYTDEEISERLITLESNINKQKYLDEIEALDFANILLFAQDHKAKKYTLEIVELFCKARYLDTGIQLDIYYVFKKLIRLHFRDDEKKTREVLTVVIKAMHPELLDELPTLKKAIDNVEKRDQIILEQEAQLTQQEKEIMKLKEKLKENNIEVD